MTIILSEQDWDELEQENGQPQTSSAYLNNYDRIWEGANRLGAGYEQEVSLRTGMYICLQIYQFREHLVEEVFPHQLWPEFAFQISGSRRLVDGTYLEPGQNFLAIGPYPAGRQEWLATQRTLKVDIHIEPHALKSFITSSWQSNSKQVCQLLDTAAQFYCRCSTTTPAMQISLNQILRCPYQGITRQIYLESKALELIALRLEEAIATDKPSCHPVLKPADVERIHHAKEILSQNFDNPPSLTALARQVGLNDRKLKQGFRQVFGTTAFGYLHDYRLERSQLLLAESQMTVTEVAHAVGYASITAFSAAFRKKFGINPLAYVTSKKLEKSVWNNKKSVWNKTQVADSPYYLT